ncbi:hypothetical protein A7D35_03180 [Xanthomonas arboricola]|nr:hypothetical protein A7D35_03180 [Xanthomonas arboricola]
MQHAVICPRVYHVALIGTLGIQIIGIARSQCSTQSTVSVVIDRRADQRRGVDDVAEYRAAITQFALLLDLTASIAQ